MDKKIVGLVGAVSGLAMMTAVEAAQARDVTEVLNARSYAELLQPIPNAAALLIASDAVQAVQARDVTEVLNARSYAELLQPIPNAVALLMASDAVNAARAKAEAEQDPNVKLAQYYHHHHHHHHHWYHHHHHHHWYHHHHHHHCTITTTTITITDDVHSILFLLIGGLLGCGKRRRVVQLRDDAGPAIPGRSTSDEPRCFGPRPSWLARRKFSRRAMNAAVSGVEYRVRRRCPLATRGERSAAFVDAPSLQFSLGSLLIAHFDEFEIGLFRDHSELRERLVRPENVCAAFSRRFEDHEEHHWPPIPYERRHRDRNAVGWVRIKAWMRLDLNRETRLDL